MRYLVRARVKSGQAEPLREAIENGTLGAGSVAGGEYIRDMQQARLCEDGTVRWVEVCYCPTPLQEERPYWEEFFEFDKIIDAHARRNCRDENGTEPWACGDCDCTQQLEEKMRNWGQPFLPCLEQTGSESDSCTTTRKQTPAGKHDSTKSTS